MLKGIPPILGDELVIADGKFPAAGVTNGEGVLYANIILKRGVIER